MNFGEWMPREYEVRKRDDEYICCSMHNSAFLAIPTQLPITIPNLVLLAYNAHCCLIRAQQSACLAVGNTSQP